MIEVMVEAIKGGATFQEAHIGMAIAQFKVAQSSGSDLYHLFCNDLTTSPSHREILSVDPQRPGLAARAQAIPEEEQEKALEKARERISNRPEGRRDQMIENAREANHMVSAAAASCECVHRGCAVCWSMHVQLLRPLGCPQHAAFASLRRR